jgi:ABC-2 type transport system ATP-binding protein
MNLLELQHLKKYYATHKAVDDISFSIAPGSIFGLLGPNGAGKTTLLRMITGIFYPDEGEILFNGRNFDPIKDIQQIGYMPEERGLYKKMKVGEQVLYLTQLKGLSEKEAKEKIKYWFRKLEITDWWNKKIGDLSKGMSQKVQFIATIAHDPALLILDEPFSGLDPINANLIKDEIFELSKKGKTIIFSTHRMEQVEEICDHIALVNEGKKILDGAVKQIKQDFKQHIFSLKLATDGGLLPVMPEGFTLVEQKEGELIIKLAENKSTNELLENFIQQGFTINSFHEILPSLNEIFIERVQKETALTNNLS